MDLDGSLKKIHAFMADMHAIFPGGAAGLKSAAAKSRNGEEFRALGDPPPEGPIDRIEEVIALGERLEALLPAVEKAIADVQDIAKTVGELSAAVSALQNVPPTESPPVDPNAPMGSHDPSAQGSG
jgi:hypothetical protein